jgi:hypothetical protein
MAECEHYEVETKNIPGREIRGDRQRQPPIVARMPWCAHPKHSPVDRVIATGTIGGGTRLQCEGSYAKCPLTEAQFGDV